MNTTNDVLRTLATAYDLLGVEADFFDGYEFDVVKEHIVALMKEMSGRDDIEEGLRADEWDTAEWVQDNAPDYIKERRRRNQEAHDAWVAAGSPPPPPLPPGTGLTIGWGCCDDEALALKSTIALGGNDDGHD